MCSVSNASFVLADFKTQNKALKVDKVSNLNGPNIAILVFALWYWRLDAGGPHGRDLRFGHPDEAFLFPQMTMHPEAKLKAGEEAWSPNFVDYLFLAFNTSTALSPTDVPVLTRWAKVLMMLQSLISLTVLVLLAARAVNIL